MNIFELNFVRESNRIEGIEREPTNGEVAEYFRFMDLPKPTVADMEHFVKIYQPNATLRDKAGLDVRVADYLPPKGSPKIRTRLEGLLDCCEDTRPYFTHIQYESIHPFTDGNGRSGRMLWAWQMARRGYNFKLGFLHKFYYQTLAAQENRH